MLGIGYTVVGRLLPRNAPLRTVQSIHAREAAPHVERHRKRPHLEAVEIVAVESVKERSRWPAFFPAPGRALLWGSLPVAAPGRLDHRLISLAPPGHLARRSLAAQATLALELKEAQMRALRVDAASEARRWPLRSEIRLVLLQPSLQPS